VPVRIRLPDGTARVPVVIFSPGLGGTITGGGLWGAAWSAAGIAVVHVQHPGSDAEVYKGATDAADRRARVAAAATAEQLTARVADVGFVVDELAARPREGACDLSRLDLAHLGIAGHSMGSWTAQAIAGQRFGGVPRFADRRFIAAIGFSPSALSRDDPALSFGGITIPFFSITGSDDGVPPARAGDDPAKAAAQHVLALSERTTPFAGMPPGRKYLLVLDGADHMAFAGTAARAAAEPHIAELTLAATIAFWGATLQGNAADAGFLQSGIRAKLAPGDRFEAK
jgi:predicted dienelactone hydrolase